MVAANRAFRVAPQLELAELHLQRVEVHQPAQQRHADADDQLDGLNGLHHADHARQHAQYAALRARRHHARRRRFGEHASVTWAAQMRREHRRLTLEAEDRPVDVRLLLEDAHVVGQVARGEIIRAVDDDVVRFGDLPGVLAGEQRVVQIDLHVGIDRADAVAGGLDLLAAHILGAVQNLALEVRIIDHVEIHQPQPPDTQPPRGTARWANPTRPRRCTTPAPP